MKKQNKYLFTIKFSGIGSNKEEAWLDACESFCMDYGPTPDDTETEISEDEV